MDVYMLRNFFMWCTIIDVGLLTLMTLSFILAGDFIYRVHARLFPMSRDAFNVVIYSIIGVFKIFVLVFNVIPYIALLIVT